MNLGFFKVLKVGIALGAGWEIGKVLPDAIATILAPNTRTYMRHEYRRKMAEAERHSRRNFRVVPDETPTTGA